MAEKTDLDEATVQIARGMLNTPPKPHEKMKLGNTRKKRTKKSCCVPTKSEAQPLKPSFA
jgi:hypothetical protein